MPGLSGFYKWVDILEIICVRIRFVSRPSWCQCQSGDYARSLGLVGVKIGLIGPGGCQDQVALSAMFSLGQVGVKIKWVSESGWCFG
jgi:hypothetical protein